MTSLFGEVWFWSLLAFLIGAILTWVLLVRPAQQRVQQLERRPGERDHGLRGPTGDQPEPGYPQPEPSEWPGGPAQDLAGEPQQQSHPRTQWLERETLTGSEGRTGVYPADEEFFEREAAADASGFREVQADQGYQDATVEDEPAGSLFEADDDYVEYVEYADYPEQQVADQDAPAIEDRLGEAGYSAPLTQFEDFETSTSYDDLDTGGDTRATEAGPRYEDEAQETAGGLFAPTPQAEPAEQSYFTEDTQAQEAAEDEEPATEATAGPDIDPATGLPKRRRGATSRIRGGFEPPRPIQPSVRPIARREPAPDNVATGSLFEPAADTGEPAFGSDSGHRAPPARGYENERSSVPAGPFGPGSAMPLPGGGRPDPSFTVKASVTALRYCTEDSPQFPRMVAEVWFASATDAERVGFRPLS